MPGTCRTYGTGKLVFRFLGITSGVIFIARMWGPGSQLLALDGPRLAIGIALLGLLAAIPVGTLFMSRNFGVSVSVDGITDRSATGSSSTEWGEVCDFAVKPERSLGKPSVTVWIVRREGSETPLRSLSNWGWRRHVVERYRDALLREFELHQAAIAVRPV